MGVNVSDARADVGPASTVVQDPANWGISNAQEQGPSGLIFQK